MKDYKHLLELFLNHLEKHQAGLSGKLPKELYEPEHYILSLGGKRLRPLLALVACDLFDKEPKLALHSAMAVELFHNFSLIHDDILDAAPLRRNKETVHVKWNTNIAILSGDVMMVKAFQVLELYKNSQYKKLNIVFSATATEVCEGQQLDMNFESSKSVTVSDYLHMITFKTAVLLGCSLKMGAINASAGKKDQAYLYEFGKHLGIAFQLLDDMLDAFAQDTEKFGKKPGGDIVANKKTFLLLKTLELANKEQKDRLSKLLKLPAKEASKKIKGTMKLYKELCVQQLCLNQADKHTAIAIDYLMKVNAGKSKKEKLKNFALELLNRQI